MQTRRLSSNACLGRGNSDQGPAAAAFDRRRYPALEAQDDWVGLDIAAGSDETSWYI